jgi:hypothetical protein
MKEKPVTKVTDDTSNNSPDSKLCDAEYPAQNLKLINLKKRKLSKSSGQKRFEQIFISNNNC